MKITSAQNPLIKQVHKLSTQKKARQEIGLTVLDGVHLLTEYLKFNQAPKEILVSEKFLNNAEFGTFKSLEYIEIPDELMTKIAPSKSPSGLLAVIEIPEIRKDPRTCGMTAHCSLITDNCKILLLDHLQDPGNVGTIIRSGVAAGFEGVYLLGSCELWSPKVLRSAQGAHFYPIEIQEIECLQDLPNVPWHSLSCEKDAQNIFKTALKPPLGLIVGNEGSGLSKETQGLYPKPIHIPMHHGFESLNAAVSASIAMFHISSGER